ncbi:PAS domain S-box-containing protein [Salinihabitans flavidus]|uniref:HTH-type transcriptional regulatory protein TyrR n=1 Tax=Salinihabitans flavidus TaxID=569882 RepID=A0A1H8VDN5_9RHOB|nr:PAS domain S-box-containing protein [Salinihabitans flavidus]
MIKPPQTKVGIGVTEALDAIPDGLIVLDGERRVVFCNREARVILGLEAEQIVDRSFSKVCRDSSLNWVLLEEMIEAGRNGNVVLRGDAVGSVFVTLRRADPTGQSDGHVIQLRDLAVFDHARRKAEGRRDPVATPGAADHRIRPDFARQRSISPWLDRMLSRGERALVQGARVIITGESGVGKTEVARHLHAFVAGATDPFVAVNCAAIPESLFESELFGYEKGAFTGASTDGKKGLIEAAEGGTLFLDEVGEIPLPLQAKLLSFLEDGVITRIGGTRPRRVNVRVISATNRDLPEMAEERQFRLDLYYRLAVVNMPMRPLRELPEILGYLVDRFLAAINKRRSVPLVLDEDMRARLLAYDYPGNIRELWNLIQQISVLGVDEDEMPRRLMALAPEEPPAQPDGQPDLSAGLDLRAAVAEYELRIIKDAIRIHGSKRKAAAALGVDIATISRKTRNR